MERFMRKRTIVPSCFQRFGKLRQTILLCQTTPNGTPPIVRQWDDQRAWHEIGSQNCSLCLDSNQSYLDRSDHTHLYFDRNLFVVANGDTPDCPKRREEYDPINDVEWEWSITTVG